MINLKLESHQSATLVSHAVLVALVSALSLGLNYTDLLPPGWSVLVASLGALMLSYLQKIVSNQ